MFSPVDKYRCENCGRVFLAANLVRTKCSENEVGAYLTDVCPKCIRKRPPRYGKLKKMEG